LYLLPNKTDTTRTIGQRLRGLNVITGTEGKWAATSAANQRESAASRRVGAEPLPITGARLQC